MKIFNKVKNFEGKVNFVDQNNVFLGYDLETSCCEEAYWFISDKIHTFEVEEDGSKYMYEKMGGDTRETIDFDITNWYFNKTFTPVIDHADYGEGMAIFEITNGTDVKYIHLINCHNGYYSHGFEFADTVSGEMLLAENI